MLDSVPMYSVSVDENDVVSGAKELMTRLRPSWNEERIKFKVFTDGITNKLVGCYLPENKDEMVLVRVYGQKTDLIIDRQKEKSSMQVLHMSGCGPELYCSFNNGICYEFVPGITFDTQLVCEEKASRLVAHEMARLHHVDARELGGEEFEKTPSLFPKLRRWLDVIPTEFEDQLKNERFSREVISKSQLRDELDLLEKELIVLQSPVVFCHNDILLNNIVYNEEHKRVTFIDYEYASYNYAAHDIGNHFAEFAGVDTVDYALYPIKEFQLVWLRNYLESTRRLQGNQDLQVTERDVELLFVQVNKFALAAHFFWGMWALIQAKHSTIDFDFLDYGIVRFNEYFAKKNEFISLKMPAA